MTGAALVGGAPLLLAACSSSAPASPAPASSSATPPSARGVAPSATSAAQTKLAAGLLPSYVPAKGGPKPDLHDDSDPRYDDVYDNYPANPFKSWTGGGPGAGGHVDVMIPAYYPAPTPFDSNSAWKEVNTRLNASVQMSITPTSDYGAKLAAVMAGNDLPDIMNLNGGYKAAPNLPDFFKAKCADLTPYLAGDAVKNYPNLAAIPTYAWKNSISAVDGHLYLVPIQRPATGAAGSYFFKITEVWDAALGANYVPKSAADFKRALQEVNRPQANQWAMGGSAEQQYNVLVAAQMFGAPNNWQLDASGKLIKERETDQYKAAVGYMRDLWAAGLFNPNSLNYTSYTQGKEDMIGGKTVVYCGEYNGWQDEWRRALQQNPPRHVGVLSPFPAQEGGKPTAYLGPGYNSANVMKQASPDRIEELLRIMNFLAAPFGSEEDLLLAYGLKDAHFTVDSRGNPVSTPKGNSEAGYVPWRYISSHPVVSYVGDLPGYGRALWDVQHLIIPIAVADPTLGFYSATDLSKGGNYNKTFFEGVIDIVVGRRPLTDYDELVKGWASGGGDQIRKEYMDAIAAVR
jgi:putative aldouronate transport system substrate-binding protein